MYMCDSYCAFNKKSNPDYQINDFINKTNAIHTHEYEKLGIFILSERKNYFGGA